MPNTSIYKKTALAVILTVQLMLAMDFLIVIVSLKDIQGDLGFTSSNLSWIPNAFGLAFGGLLLLGGRLGDIIGQVKAFKIGVAIFVLASFIGGLATSPSILIIARTFQGVGSALAAPSVLALITILAKDEAETRVERVIDSTEINAEQKIAAKEMGLEHQLFFASDPKESDNSISSTTDDFIYAVVDGDQVVKANSRLRMRLTKAATINNKHIPKNTPIYGFINFQPNRVLIEIENIKNHPTKLKAFDLQDGSEGIYVENNFRAQVSTEVIGDMVDDINIAGVPQVSGFKKIFQRNNRNVKVTVLNNYKLILKPKL